MSALKSFLESIIGQYDTTLSHPDWEWVCCCAFLLLIVWGIIIIVRSVISRHG